MTTRRRAILAGLMSGSILCGAAPAAAADEGDECRPTSENRPVCPADARAEAASFLDDSARVEESREVRLEGSVYVGPFARLLADDDAPISIGAESNVQDSVTIVAESRDRDRKRGHRRGRGRANGVQIGERVILAHGATVKGPARVGVEGSDVPGNTDGRPEVFTSFGAEIDGAVVEGNTQVSALARVGPGVRLRSGRVVLAGKNVDSQREADDPALGKVRDITPADIAFAEAVIEVNTALAREYSRLARERRSNVRGINFDPGNTPFNASRDLPQTDSEGVEPGTDPEDCIDGRPTRRPGFRNRIIGEVCLGDPASRLDDVMGSGISLRADEGDPLQFGEIRRMESGVISHALEETTVEVGDDVYYGRGAIVHGGGRRQDGGGRGTESTFVEDDVTLGRQSVTFRSLVGAGSRIGRKSAVVNSELAPGTRIPDRVVYVGNAVVGRVEW